jgi:hypothetical protein
VIYRGDPVLRTMNIYLRGQKCTKKYCRESSWKTSLKNEMISWMDESYKAKL